MHRFTSAAIVALIAGGASAGPDVICGELTGVNNYGEINGIRAYSIGTTSCNIGDEPADWIAETPRHPVISATIWKYDFESERLRQIGLTQLKHSFAALQNSACDPCSGGFTFDALLPGCSDPYTAGLNADQRDLGPRAEVNAYTGEFPYPFTGINQTGNAVFKRIQVPQSEIEDSTANFYAEGSYTLQDDFEAGTQMNNASYSAFSINQSTFSASTPGQTFRETPAIYAWQAEDPSVQITEVDVPNDGRLIVASNVTDLGDGTYRYDYGVYNQNSDKSVASFSVPTNSDASGFFFHDVSYHGPFDNNVKDTDWDQTSDSSSLSWSTDTFDQDQWANAIRWGTMYNFSFETDSPPVQGDVTLGTFKGGETVTTGAFVPEMQAQGCPIDYNGNGEADFGDLNSFIDFWSQDKPPADLNDNGSADFGDINMFTTLFQAGCP